MGVATAAIVGAAALGAGASMMAGNKQARGYEDSAALLAEAQQAAVAEQRRQYDQTRTDFAPWRETGVNALGEYGRLYGIGRDGLISPDEMVAARERFRETPGYQFRFDEGLKALDRSAAARGRLRGGGYTNALQRYGQGIASDEFNNYANALARLAGGGQAATGSTAAAGQGAANAIGNITMQGAAAQGNALSEAATARASGYAGVGNALIGAGQNYMLSEFLKRPMTTQQGWASYYDL